jgi:general secretion pathway protein J
VTLQPQAQRGFTLIEVLVALAVFGVLAALSYGALNQTLQSADILNDRLDRLQALQKTMRILGQDFFQLAPRPVRDELGETWSASLRTDVETGFALELTHGGWNNPMALPRGTLQRSAYRIEEDELIRYHWNVLDRTFSNEPVIMTLLDGVESIAFRFLESSGEWTLQWPSLNAQGQRGLRLRPRAVEVVITLEDEGEITRLFEVSP